MKEKVVSFSVFRVGYDIFVEGLPRQKARIRVNKAVLNQRTSAVVGNSSCLEAVPYKSGIKVRLRRLSDGAMLFCWLLSGSQASIYYDRLKF